MNAILFGATGMVGQGVLRECLLDHAIMAPLYPLLRRLLPHYVTTTEQLGRAMISVVKTSATNRVLESNDINAISAKPLSGTDKAAPISNLNR